jgi:hypothetical protein
VKDYPEADAVNVAVTEGNTLKLRRQRGLRAAEGGPQLRARRVGGSTEQLTTAVDMTFASANSSTTVFQRTNSPQGQAAIKSLAVKAANNATATARLTSKLRNVTEDDLQVSPISLKAVRKRLLLDVVWSGRAWR